MIACSLLISFGHVEAYNHPVDKRSKFRSQEKTFNILTYGAKGDGTFLNTRAIQSAIDDAHQQNGGKVLIPTGNFLTGSIILKSGVELHLQENAVLLGSTNFFDYQGLDRWLALILADHQRDIAISGKGTIDGQGQELALNIDSLIHIGKVEDPRYNHRRRRPNEAKRPQIIEFVRCKNIRVSGVTILDAACWVQTYHLCENLRIDSITVRSNAYWNNDGIDIEDCKNVQITNCDIDSADDGICLKSETKGASCDSVFIANCRVRSSASAIKFGTSSHGGFRNVKIQNISVYDTYRSAIALESVDGGTLENIEVSDVEAKNTGNAIFIRLGHRNVDGEVGIARNIKIKNVKVEVPFEQPDLYYPIRGPALPFFHNPIPSSVTGIPGHKVENVVLENIEIVYPGRANKGYAYMPLSRLSDVPEAEKEYPEFSMFQELPSWGLYVRHVDGIELKNIRLRTKEADFRPAFVFDDVTNLRLEGADLPLSRKAQVILNDVSTALIKLENEKILRTLGNCTKISVSK